MILEREKQNLLLDGVVYLMDDIRHLIKNEKYIEDTALHDLFLFLEEWFDESPFMTVHTSGSTGTPKQLTVSKERMMQSARITCEFLHLQKGDTTLLCMNLRYIGAKMIVVRSLVAGLNLIVRRASGHPLADVSEEIKFTAMVPLQVYNTLRVPEEKEKLCNVGALIIGGGAIDNSLEAEIQKLPGRVYSSYGMTETLSHIALRPLNGSSATGRYYPFPSVKLSLSDCGTLQIDAPLVCDELLCTNDVAHIYPDGSFIILGRRDNVINSGGIKIQAETVEDIIRPYINSEFVLTSVSDERLGEAVVSLVEKVKNADMDSLKEKLSPVLDSYRFPKYFVEVSQIPHTGNDKIDRKACKALADKLLSTKK